MSHPVINRTIATWKLYLDPRFSHMTQPISQLASWRYTEKRLPVITTNEKHWLQFWEPYIVMFCKIANHWPGGFIETRVRGISSHFHDGVPMQCLCQDLLQKRWFEKTQRIRSWRRTFSCDKCFKTFNRKDAYVRHERTYSIICKYCDTEFDSGSDLSIHVQSQHTDKKYMCSKCGKKYVDKRDLKKHQQNCSQTVSSFTLRWIINRIRNGVKGLRHYNFYYINFTGWFTWL